jgi:drug/metabolite transporter (DMT)-like permease
MPAPRENLGLLLGFIGMLAFAGTVPAARLAVAAIDPWFLTLGRAALAGIAALIIVVAARRRLPPRATLASFVVGAVGVVYGFPLLSSLALVTVPAAHGGVVLGILPMATAACAAAIAHERPSIGFWLASAAGAALVVGFALRHGGAASLVGGDLLLVGAIASAAIGYTLLGRLSLAMPGWEVICWALVLTLPVAVPAALATWPADVSAIPPSAWAAFLYVSLISQLVGFFAWNAGLAFGGIARVSQMQLMQPFVIVALAAVVNAEPIEAETLLFAAAVVATVMVGRTMRIAR